MSSLADNGKHDEKGGGNAVDIRPPVPVQYEQLQELQQRQRLLELCMRSFILVEERISLCEQLEETLERARGGRNRQSWRDAETQLEAITPLRQIKGLLDIDETFAELVGQFDDGRDRTLKTVRGMIMPGVDEGTDVKTSLYLFAQGVNTLKDTSRTISDTCKESAQAELGEIADLIVGIIKVAEALEGGAASRIDRAEPERPEMPVEGLQELRQTAGVPLAAPAVTPTQDRKLTLG